MTEVAKHIVEAYMIHRELKRIHDAKEEKAHAFEDKYVPFVPLQYANVEHARPFNIMSTVHCYSKLMLKAPGVLHVQIFLNRLGSAWRAPV